jgi:hypothetical protein
MATDVAEILERAADLIEPEGAWVQGAFKRLREGSGVSYCYCAAGALIEVASSDSAYDEARRFLNAQLPRPSDPEDSAVIAFNDADGRTQAEVVAALREAAAKARSVSA